MSEDRVKAKQRRDQWHKFKDARRRVDEMPLLEINFHGAPLGYFSKEQLIKIVGWLATHRFEQGEKK